MLDSSVLRRIGEIESNRFIFVIHARYVLHPNSVIVVDIAAPITPSQGISRKFIITFAMAAAHIAFDSCRSNPLILSSGPLMPRIAAASCPMTRIASG